MAIDFPKAKESCLRSISYEIKWAGEAGEAYMEDTKKGGGFDPSLADLDRYLGMEGWSSVEKYHRKALALLEAENIDDLRDDVKLAYDVCRRALLEQKNVSPEEALETFERYADMGMTDASLKAGLLRFVGYGCERDPAKALEHFRRAEAGGSDEAAAWVRFYTDEPCDDDDWDAEPFEDHARYYSMVPKEYECPLDPYPPEWKVLQCVSAESPQDLMACDPYDGTASNNVYELHPFYWGDRVSPESQLPNFAFKPTGLEVTWYKNPMDSASMNQPLSPSEFRHVIRLCIEHAIECRCWEGGR
ncbi:MAG: sel1 repeat family protein [Candidatus Methanomethylophilaceae archaeon]|nr:sel1 repeat family protein [Candidatus Methanomethylophilaceae archaeon]